jgi:5-methylcytosine-specific restriction protein B
VPLRITQILEAPVSKAQLLDERALANLHILKAPFGTNFKVTAEEWAVIEPLITGTVAVGPRGTTLKEVAAETGFPAQELQRWLNAIDRKGQGVLYGPPGTGKTYVAERLAKLLIGNSKGFHELVQFHPAYAYEDFIQGLRPVLTPKGGLDYRLVPGRFLEFCRKAERYTGTCVLILDEINRANLARVFGELMYLLEYRDQTVPLASGGELRIPKNVRLIGTMNTADRSIALVDHALRRRFAFIHLRPQYSVLEKYHHEKGYDAAALVKLLRRLNQAIDDPHYEVGISFFLRPDLATHLEDIWRMEIEPYLEEYFFDQAAKAKQFLWEDLKKELA